MRGADGPDAGEDTSEAARPRGSRCRSECPAATVTDDHKRGSLNHRDAFSPSLAAGQAECLGAGAAWQGRGSCRAGGDPCLAEQREMTESGWCCRQCPGPVGGRWLGRETELAAAASARLRVHTEGRLKHPGAHMHGRCECHVEKGHVLPLGALPWWEHVLCYRRFGDFVSVDTALPFPAHQHLLKHGATVFPVGVGAPRASSDPGPDFCPHLPDVSSLPDPNGQGLWKRLDVRATVRVLLVIGQQEMGLEGPSRRLCLAKETALPDTENMGWGSVEVEAGDPHGLRRGRPESSSADRALRAGRMPMASVAVGKLLLIQEDRHQK